MFARLGATRAGMIAGAGKGEAGRAICGWSSDGLAPAAPASLRACGGVCARERAGDCGAELRTIGGSSSELAA